ncbi:hypothetical protein C6W92_16525 [Roseovarius sp. A46]|uniref:hypothetical protein n=1 Tax=Roseovarius sp. A46 TaxID=2109331 RepID=UPI00101192DB|nr:hypothetical protein [Roseovarius sp. A46]RXV58629.1 hypothetical protein C6W92_16525 [Roseovarius sp. A46]
MSWRDVIGRLFKHSEPVPAERPLVSCETSPELERKLDHLEHKLDEIRPNTAFSKELAKFGFLARARNPQDPKQLSGYAQVYSQFGEDGYIQEIFSRIGEGGRTFLEFGIEDGTQNTTRFLLERGWSGVWVEGSEAFATRAAETFHDFIEAGQLQIIHGFVTAENVNSLLDQNGIAAGFDLMSVDLDQNTSHVWRRLNRTARVACVEYNASLPPYFAVEVPYDPARTWDGSNHYGASLKTLEDIGRGHGMHLVGCDYPGVNAYFVHADETADKFLEPFTSERHYEPPRYNALDYIGHPPPRDARRWMDVEDPERS